ncbi:conjugative transposon protein TraM [Alistipes finegoldii]|uniref:conjugative transposon protein TraM n=1 Tax=Alistipes finegoldii TaxID=214856 RepID=UPI003C6C8D56
MQLRLQEAVRIDETVTIPRNTPLYGLATIAGMRLQVTVSSVEYGGRIFAVEAVAYDLDGQPGLNVPNSRERTALKEALASVGQTAGTSVNVTRSAGQQVLVRAGARRIAGFVAVCRREAPRGEDNPQSQPSAIIDFKRIEHT